LLTIWVQRIVEREIPRRYEQLGTRGRLCQMLYL
jgi:hypothetical protein